MYSGTVHIQNKEMFGEIFPNSFIEYAYSNFEVEGVTGAWFILVNVILIFINVCRLCALFTIVSVVIIKCCCAEIN